jgi:hypothetical protein
MTSRHAVALALQLCLFGCSFFGDPGTGGPDPLTTDAGPEWVDAGPFDCFGLTNCANACSTQQCIEACQATSTTTAQILDSALQNCIDTNCPATDGGPCEMQASGACQTCVEDAPTTGPCAADNAACIDDMSGSAGDQGGTGCTSLNNCLDSCQSINCDDDCFAASSSVGYQLYTIFVECLDQTCPSTATGQCAVASNQTCESCETTAVNAGGACATAYANCQNSP